MQNNKQLLEFLNSDKIFLQPFKDIFYNQRNYDDFSISANFINKVSATYFLNKTSFNGFEFIEQKKKEKDFYKLVISKIFVYVCLIGIPIAFIGALFSFANGVAVDSFGKVFLLLILSNLHLEH